MQHVKKSWLSWLAYGLLTIDALLVLAFLGLEAAGTTEMKARWGITPTILTIAAVHAVYISVIFPVLRKKQEWWASIVSLSIYGVLFAAIIESSGNTNIYYRLGYAVLVFFMAMTGPFAPIAAIVLTWVVLIFSITGVATPTNASLTFNLVINSTVTAAGISGWLIFRKYYSKDVETLNLTEQLQEEQFKSNAILESITDGVIVTNTKNVVEIINVAAATMLGWSKEEALGLDYHSLIKPQYEDEAEAPIDPITTTMKSGEPSQLVCMLHTAHGRKLFVDIVASPIYQNEVSEDGATSKKLSGVIGVLRDVDEQKRQEQQRSEFISTASHEMRTPVAAIQGYLELALNPKVSVIDEKAKTYLTKAYDSTKHLGKLFQDLLTTTKSEDGQLVHHPEIVDIAELLAQVGEQEQTNAQKKGLQLTVGTQHTDRIGPLLYAHIDPERLKEVLLNLVENAIKYTPKGMVTLGAEARDTKILVKVSDTGMGIAEEDMPHLFQKFYRVDSSATREIGGTGLGLFISKQIIETMGGKIWVESKLGEGSSFFIELPRINPTEVQQRQNKTNT